MTAQFENAFATFYEGVVRINREYMDRHFPNNRKDEFRYVIGGRYVKVIRGGSAHCFVDIQTGDVLKPASFRAPAKHARGNIYDAQNGLGAMQEYGPAYLR